MEPINYLNKRLYLQTIRVDNLIADGALHQHEVELIVLFSEGVLLPSFFAHQAHCSVGQHRLQWIENVKLNSKCYSPRFRTVLFRVFRLSARCQNKTDNGLMIYRNALSHNAGLLHSPRPSKLLHVPAEVTLPTLVPEARFALAAAGPPAPSTRRAPAGRHLNG